MMKIQLYIFVFVALVIHGLTGNLMYWGSTHATAAIRKTIDKIASLRTRRKDIGKVAYMMDALPARENASFSMLTVRSFI